MYNFYNKFLPLEFHAAQVLIKKNCKFLPVGCLQNPLLGETLTFDVASEGCVQILHSGGNHWITITVFSKRPPVVRIYDSLNTQLPDSTKKQIASLIFTEEKSIELEYINVCVSYYNINYA